MIARTILLFALLAVSTTVLAGAWFGSAPKTMPIPAVPFSPQNVPLDPTVLGLDAQGLLAQTIKRLELEPTGWLSAKIRQTMNGPRGSFVAEGGLQTGPNQCVRLEMEVIKNSTRGRLIVISDGVVMAKVRALPETPDLVHVENLPESPAERQSFLANHGAGGPIALLRQLRLQLQDATLRVGTLGNRAVIQIHGTVPRTSVPTLNAMAADSIPTDIYVDAKSLAPVRVDWMNAMGQPLLQMEFNDFELGRELSAEECARVFSYHPAGNERVTRK